MSRHRIRGAVVRQFHTPNGPAGHVAGWIMGHRKSNVERNRWAVSVLDLGPDDRVLELGCGPGVAVQTAAARATNGLVVAVDHSLAMVHQTRRRNAAAVRAGRVEVVHAGVDALPDFGTPFDAVLAVNSCGFWPDPPARLRELRNRLRPGGRIALASQPRCAGATAETSARAGEELVALLTEAGYVDARVETLALDPPAVCVVGNNPGTVDSETWPAASTRMRS